MKKFDSIPSSFINNYLDQLLKIHKDMPDGLMREAIARRMEVILDLVEAYKKTLC